MTKLFQQIREGASPEPQALFDVLVEHLPLLFEMEGTEQDPEWHAEGNVWVHTSMVLERAYGEWDGHGDRLVHVLASFLHDIGKTLTTKRSMRDGLERVVSPRHAKVGRSYLLPRLHRTGLDQPTIDAVVSLVGYHHYPRPSMAGRFPKINKLYQQQRVCDTRSLFRLERADIQGRLGPDEEEQLLMLDLFKLECEEQGLWDNPAPYSEWIEEFTHTFSEQGPEFVEAALYKAIYDYERGRFGHLKEGIARSYQMRDGFPTLIMLCGPPGSGKSTWRSGYEHVVCLDDIRSELRAKKKKKPDRGFVMQTAWERLREHLRANHTVVWDATCITEKTRRKTLQLGKDYGAYVQIVAFDVDPDEASQRNFQRDTAVPAYVFWSFVNSWEFPDETEAHRLRIVGRDGERTPGSF